jgi:hypothetical protein
MTSAFRPVKIQTASKSAFKPLLFTGLLAIKRILLHFKAISSHSENFFSIAKELILAFKCILNGLMAKTALCI